MDITNRYVIYNEVGGDGGHLFFKCGSAIDFWERLGMDDHRNRLATIASAREAVRYIVELNQEPQLKMVIRMWMWWAERNEIIEERIRRPITLLVNSVQSYIGEI